MPASAERISADIAAIAQFTQTPGAGATRPTFSVPWRTARDYIASQAEAIGCRVRIDAAGNLHARPSAISWDAPAWMSGSHLDTIRNGGDYDGVVGVVTALETLRAAKEDLKMACPMELIVWAGSENALFGESWIGSRAFLGEIDANALSNLKNPQGQSYIDAGSPHGVNRDTLATDILRPGTVIGYIETHVEESASMWEQDIRVACVTAMASRRQYRCDLTSPEGTGAPDALAAAAEAILTLEKLQSIAPLTVGQIDCLPNIATARAKSAGLGITLRSAEMTVLAMADQAIRKAIEKVAQGRHVNQSLTLIHSQTGVDMDRRVCAKLQKAASACRVDPLAETTSDYPHDATTIAARIPTGMLMVASREGITHAPEEFARPEDIAVAACILMETVRDRRLE